MLPPVWIMVVPHSSSWSKSKCNPEMDVTRIRETEVCCLISKVNALNGWVWTSWPAPISPRFPCGWLKYPVHLDTPTLIGWEEVSTRKVTPPSTILVLGGFILEFQWDPGQSLGFNPPFFSSTSIGLEFATVATYKGQCLTACEAVGESLRPLICNLSSTLSGCFVRGPCKIWEDSKFIRLSGD